MQALSSPEQKNLRKKQTWNLTTYFKPSHGDSLEANAKHTLSKTYVGFLIPFTEDIQTECSVKEAFAWRFGSFLPLAFRPLRLLPRGCSLPAHNQHTQCSQLSLIALLLSRCLCAAEAGEAPLCSQSATHHQWRRKKKQKHRSQFSVVVEWQCVRFSFYGCFMPANTTNSPNSCFSCSFSLITWSESVTLFPVFFCHVCLSQLKLSRHSERSGVTANEQLLTLAVALQLIKQVLHVLWYLTKL